MSWELTEKIWKITRSNEQKNVLCYELKGFLNYPGLHEKNLPALLLGQ